MRCKSIEPKSGAQCERQYDRHVPHPRWHLAGQRAWVSEYEMPTQLDIESPQYDAGVLEQIGAAVLEATVGSTPGE